MKNLKRLLAIIGIVLLAGMYVLTFIFALIDSSKAGNLLMASLFATVFIPILLYAISLIYKWTRGREDLIPQISEEGSDINTVIFDIGNVLVSYDPMKPMRELKYDEATAAAVANAIFLSPQWAEADLGVLTEEELLQAFLKNDPAREKEIRETFSCMGKTIKEYSYTRGWLKYLKRRGYKIYILSNFSEPLYRQAANEMRFLDLVDGGYMSWQVHLLKPQPEFYQKLIQDFDIDPSRAVFLDDVLENVAEARAQGLHAVHFTGRKNALQALAEFGVK